MKTMAAVVLAGGRGKRMDILCHVRPKPAISFAGGFRVIDFSLSNCIHSGIKKIFTLTDYQRFQMAIYLNRWKVINAGDVDFSVLEPSRGSYMGTADAVYQNLRRLEAADTDAFLILAGDHVYKMDYRKMYEFHEKKQADITVGVVTVPLDESFRFGTVDIGDDSRIIDFEEKTAYPKSNIASMGIYIFNKSILRKALVEDAANPDSVHDFGYAILPKMVKQHRVYAYEFNSYWQDIGTKNAYYAANMELIREEPSFSLNSHWHILTDEYEWPPVKKMADETGNITNSLIGKGCDIRGRVENSVLSPGVRIEKNVVVKNSILMSGVVIGPNVVIEHCILDENVSIGEFCFLGFGPGLIPEEFDVTVIGKNSVVPPHTAIGKNCQIHPNVKPSDFTDNIVLPGSNIFHVSSRSKKPVLQ